MYRKNQYGTNDGFASAGLVPGFRSIIYRQTEYLFPITSEHKFMPYVTYSYQNLKSTPNNTYEMRIGTSWIISGHNAKITAEYNTGKKGALNALPKNLTRIQLHVFI